MEGTITLRELQENEIYYVDYSEPGLDCVGAATYDREKARRKFQEYKEKLIDILGINDEVGTSFEVTDDDELLWMVVKAEDDSIKKAYVEVSIVPVI